jgi:transposase
MRDIRVKGRKRHLLVDTLGIPLSFYVTPANMHDTQGARRLLAGLKYFVPRLKTICADGAYRGRDLADWCKAVGDWDLASRGAFAWGASVHGSTEKMDRRTYIRLAVPEPAHEQRPRAQGANQ